MKDPLRRIIAVTKKQSIEFGLVAILLLTFLAIYFKENYFVIVAFFLALIAIVFPLILSPFAFLWFGMSKIMGAVSSRILLTIIFFLIVAPVGIFRRILKKNSLKTDQFKQSKESVMLVRDHLYTSGDLFNTF